MEFELGDHVKVIIKNSVFSGKEGNIIHFHGGDNVEDSVVVKISEKEVGFFVHEIEKVDPSREALIELAETLDKARLQANAIEEAAPQRGVYGDIHIALVNTLALITDDHEAVYASIMEDGNTVRQALKAYADKQ